MQYYLGVDFGSQQDYTAMALVRRNEVIKARTDAVGVLKQDDVVVEYQLIFLERIELGTAYHLVVDRIQSILRDQDVRGEIIVIPDATGVGIPIVQMMRRQGISPMAPVTIHGGSETSRTKTGYNVPKRDLVSSLVMVVQSRRMKIASDIKYRAQLVHEMQSFTMKTTAKDSDTYEALMEKDHDDLVLALAMAIWYAERAAPAPEYEEPVNIDLLT